VLSFRRPSVIDIIADHPARIARPGATVKKCPFCAEDIQDEAKVCKHCQRDLTASVPRRKKPTLWLVILGIIVVGSGVAYFAQSRTAPPPLTSLQQAGIPKPPPVTTDLVNSNSVEIPAGSYKQYAFTIKRTDCRLTGRVEGVDGGQKELEVRVLADDDFINWKNQPDNSAFGVFKSPRETVTSVDVALPTAGGWSLVVSNHWAAFVGKTALVHAQVTCG
jgi:predicted nucleic acid-binding Zn ribbon protein